jgi:Domain of unknown function (DUF4926)
MQNRPLELLDVVALLVDKPEERLVRGQVGTVVELLSPDVYEVEFLDSKGHRLTRRLGKPGRCFASVTGDLLSRL